MGDMMRFFVEQRLSERKSLTPEGFLLCENVPISRTGELLYVEGEIPVEADSSGLIIVERPEDVVFDPEAMASFEGKPVTMGHPDDDVNPGNWQELAVGTVQNVRRGQGIFDDCVVADLLITEASAIEKAREDSCEVSCGYDSAYEQVAPGRGVQRQIVGNHVALVERGRCGPRCSIRDKRGVNMGDQVKKKPSLTERLLASIAASAAGAGARTADEEGALHLHLGGEGEGNKAMDEFMKSCDKRFADLETMVKGLADGFTKFAKDAEAGDPDAKVTDEEAEENKKEESSSKDTLAVVLSRAEILAPGFRLSMPTFDAKNPKGAAKRFRDSVCGCKRQALAEAYKTEAGKKAIEPFTGGPVQTFDGLSETVVDVAFLGASELLKAQNNAGAGRTSVKTKDFGAAVDASSINKRNTDFWKQHGVH